MIEKSILQSCPFPCLLINELTEEEFLRHRGSLFPSERGLLNKEQVEFYKKSEFGWNSCPLGYAFFKKELDCGLRHTLIIFGLKVPTVSNVSGKSEFLSIKLEKVNVEDYVGQIEFAIQKGEKVLQRLVSSNLHEIRAINANIYNTALELRGDVERGRASQEKLIYSLRNVESLSELVSLRATYLDIVSNVPTSKFKSNVLCPYKKFDKVVKSLMPFAKSKKINLKISGVSRSIIQGINLFDMLPYIVISNAIKYAPRDSDISVKIREAGDDIMIEVISKGPLVEPDEYKKIFDHGYRGLAARKVATEGDGIGLFFANKITESCPSAFIGFKQKRGVSKNISGVNYYTSVVQIGFKIYEKRQVSGADRILEA